MKNLILKKNIGIYLGTGFFLLLLFASIPNQGSKTMMPTPMVPKFDYSPPTEGFVKAKGIRLCMIKPRFEKEYLRNNPQISQLDNKFIENMRSDFEEMLIARGYTISQIHESYDDLVYSDKNDADLVLEAVMSWTMYGQQQAFKYQPYSNSGTNEQMVRYWYDGPGTFGGRMVLTLSEPFTREKVFVQALPLPESSVYFKTYSKYQSPASQVNLNFPPILLQDALMHNSLVPALEKIYDESLALAWRHMEAENLDKLKKQAAEIKKNSSFSK